LGANADELVVVGGGDDFTTGWTPAGSLAGFGLAVACSSVSADALGSASAADALAVAVGSALLASVVSSVDPLLSGQPANSSSETSHRCRATKGMTLR
jgi:hypothetical protein